MKRDRTASPTAVPRTPRGRARIESSRRVAPAGTVAPAKRRVGGRPRAARRRRAQVENLCYGGRARGGPCPGAGVGGQRSQDGGAQPAPSERSPGWAKRTTGDGAWAVPSGANKNGHRLMRASAQVENLCYGSQVENLCYGRHIVGTGARPSVGGGRLGPARFGSSGSKPSVRAGESSASVKSPLAGSANRGSATSEPWS